MHHVYIVRCADGTLYTGYALDPEARVAVHNSGRGARYTKSRLPVTLVYSEACASKSQALVREHQLKQLTRAGKERLFVSRLASVVIVALLVTACSSPPPSASVTSMPGELVDLSHTYDASTIFWPTSETFRLDTVAEGMTPGGYYYAANNFFTAEHGGTHIDAPVHFAQGKQTVDRIPLDRLVAQAVVVDVTSQAARDADYQITIGDIEQAEQQDGPIPADTILLLRTGFSQRWPDAARYLGTAERGEAAVAKLHFPGLHPDAARWLATNRQIRAIGIDTASIDYGQSTQYQSHRVLFEHDIPAFENLTALERLPRRGALIVALPMKIGGGSGAPLRALAILPPNR